MDLTFNKTKGRPEQTHVTLGSIKIINQMISGIQMQIMKT